LPLLKREIEAGKLDVDNIDVFCEKGVFDVNQTEAILTKAQTLIDKINVNFHSDELYPLNSVEMAVKIKSKAVSHLEEISDHEIDLMAKSETVGILLPTTALVMQLKRPPARKSKIILFKNYIKSNLKGKMERKMYSIWAEFNG
jgi:imidazolonepropionase